MNDSLKRILEINKFDFESVRSTAFKYEKEKEDSEDLKKNQLKLKF